MIPYILLTGAKRNQVNRVLEEHAFEDDTVRATVALLEEFGPEEGPIVEALRIDEQRGYLRSGTFNDLIAIMAGQSTAEIDWRDIPRRGKL